ncbi:hypothetical protein [Alteromonas lipolytica]|uniref:Uncharacterized protein n=1 Tax=Alteromonas lipolytica TaxID=1856405 RepID=A0A1E8FJP3_9ALTE|nr:hypothetical protein [Alteromonas lipolytica]OFI36157.1 hypothetical protein BFC17_08495 [Alteromonas lipolytica]GGF78243.1 hypothetical protein GCM10011338_33310 [Alteromonas lipolytica]
MNWYDFWGTVNSLFILVSLAGVFSQLNTIWRRKQAKGNNQRPTQLLSLNQFTVSFLAYLSFFTYGYSIEPFNHYIVWPRLCAAALVALILLEIWRDRKTSQALLSVSLAAGCLVLAVLGLFVGETVTDEGKYISTSLIVLVTVLIAQGYYHQIRIIVNAGDTGAVDLRMSQFILAMDISTIAFALSMGVKTGWPLLLLAITSGVTKLVIMYLFKWVKSSPTARARRATGVMKT